MKLQYLVLVLLCGQLSTAGDADKDAGTQQLREIVRRHSEFAVSHLKDDEPFVASAALDALATLDCDRYMDQLRETLQRPAGDPSLDVALFHLTKRASPDDLKRVKEIVSEAAKKGDEDRKTDPFLADLASTEFFALEVLLASNDPKAVQFATTYLETTVKRNSGPGITQMECALDLIGQYQVKSAVAKIPADVNKELRDVVLLALAKNGDQAALRTLKSRVDSMDKIAMIVSDSKIVDKMGLTPDQLRAVYRKGDESIRIQASGQLARLGHMEELRAMTQNRLKDADSTFFVENMVGRYGDKSFVPDLDDRASKAATTVGKLSLSQSIFRIVRRHPLAEK